MLKALLRKAKGLDLWEIAPDEGPVKSRSRDPNAMDYGLFALIDVQTNGAVNPAIAQRWVCSWSLDEVKDYLEKPPED